MTNRVEKNCAHCSKLFSVPQHRALTAKYCSRKCLAQYPRDTSKWKVITGNCIRCGKEYRTKASHVAIRKFCSHACRGAAKTERFLRTLSCAQCGSTFLRVPNKKTKYCSPTCRNRGAADAKRKWHPNPQGYMVSNFTEAGKTRHRLEHRVLMEKALGRPLEKYETVHHKNGVKNDNRLDNLEVWIHRPHKGQRPEELIPWMIECLSLYGYHVTKL